jgi:primosomal protein N' (replication factor Y) (superfamily II helicase)
MTDAPNATDLFNDDTSHRVGVVSVLLPLGIPGPYDYAVPPKIDVAHGDFVTVPLGPREVLGVVWGDGSGEVGHNRLKPIIERLDVPPMSRVLRQFIDWIATYTLAPPGAVLRLAIRAPGALEPAATRIVYRLGGPAPSRMTPGREKVLEVAQDHFARTTRELAEEAGVSTAVVRGLIDAGTFEAVELPADAPFGLPDIGFKTATLSDDQAFAADQIKQRLQQGGFSAQLLDGVTGSGKTEVYFEAVAKIVEQGRQALILLPEIALTGQFLERFEQRFGCRPAEWHSDLSSRERKRVWRGVADGSARVVVGARSALFLPFPDLGLIVVDEEHESAFKQEEGVTYNARDMSVVRASLGGFPVVLASATPSLETMANVWNGKYDHLTLPERHGPAVMPAVGAIDMRATPPERGEWLSPPLMRAIAEAMAKGEQAMLFLNRRGYAPLTLCRTCGHRIECPQCDSWLVEHRFRKELSCHHCGYTAPVPRSCPSCNEEDALIACGPGVERIAEEVVQKFPQARLALLSSDSLRGPSSHADAIRQIADHEVDIIVGTQIVAKGHNFPLLTVVGVVDADLGLENGDLRAAERTFQLLHQVAGRAGRADRPGRVYLQTYLPEHPVMQALIEGARDPFLEREAAMRERTGYPPYGRLVALIISGENPKQVNAVSRELGRTHGAVEGISVFGPAPAPLALLRGRHRMRFLVKSNRNIAIQDYVAEWLSRVKVPSAVRVSVDVDPYSFL